MKTESIEEITTFFGVLEQITEPRAWLRDDAGQTFVAQLPGDRRLAEPAGPARSPSPKGMRRAAQGWSEVTSPRFGMMAFLFSAFPVVNFPQPSLTCGADAWHVSIPISPSPRNSNAS